MESLANPVQETLSVFNIQNDIILIDNINLKFNQLDSFRDSSLALVNTKIDELRKQLENIKASIKSLKNSNQSKTTKTELKNLENEIFNSARNLTSLNMEINSLKLSYNQNLKKLDDLQSDLNKINLNYKLNNNSTSTSTSTSTSSNTGGSNNSSVDENTNLIKLKLFNSTGIKFNEKNLDEVLILNKPKNSISVLKIDDNYSQYFISNYIWDNM